MRLARELRVLELRAHGRDERVDRPRDAAARLALEPRVERVCDQVQLVQVRQVRAWHAERGGAGRGDVRRRGGGVVRDGRALGPRRGGHWRRKRAAALRPHRRGRERQLAECVRGRRCREGVARLHGHRLGVLAVRHRHRHRHGHRVRERLLVRVRLLHVRGRKRGCVLAVRRQRRLRQRLRGGRAGARLHALVLPRGRVEHRVERRKDPLVFRVDDLAEGIIASDWRRRLDTGRTAVARREVGERRADGRRVVFVEVLHRLRVRDLQVVPLMQLRALRRAYRVRRRDGGQ
mmetsp:Transcript_14126/g.44113  ORF Transcript_14126/g.44113 Transcript_14126/m.44113 type:complete len:291 (-) Transcript_14126:103-975(-)